MNSLSGTRVIDLIYSAWTKDIDPEDVEQVLNGEGIDIDIDTIRGLYKAYDIKQIGASHLN